MAGALARLGVAFGNRLMGGGEDNPSGYYEHRDVIAMHDEMALQNGRTWDDPRPAAPDLHTDSTRTALAAAMRAVIAREFADAPLWALKDPRLCRFLPAWLDLLDADGIDARCLLMLRSPTEVAASLARRNGFSSEKSAALWLDHVIEVLRRSSGRRRARARFDELLDDPAATLDRCADELGLHWPRELGAATDELVEFIRPELHHHRDARWDPKAGIFAELAGRVWRELTTDESWPDPQVVDDWYRGYAQRFDSIPALILEHATQVAERASRDRAWLTEKSIHRDLEPLLTDLEQRLAEAISDLAGQATAHSQELVTQGEAITALAERLEEQHADEERGWLRRLLERRD